MAPQLNSQPPPAPGTDFNVAMVGAGVSSRARVVAGNVQVLICGFALTLHRTSCSEVTKVPGSECHANILTASLPRC